MDRSDKKGSGAGRSLTDDLNKFLRKKREDFISDTVNTSTVTSNVQETISFAEIRNAQQQIDNEALNMLRAYRGMKILPCDHLPHGTMMMVVSRDVYDKLARRERNNDNKLS